MALALGRRKVSALLIAAALAAAAPAAPIESQLTAPGPQGSLAGTLLNAGKRSPVGGHHSRLRSDRPRWQ